MRTINRSIATAALLLISFSAIAADPNGLLTLVVGIPLLLIASAVLAIMLIMRPSRSVKVVPVILFAPTLVYSLYVALDARTLLSDIGSENSMIGLTFFGLLAISCFLFCQLVRRRPRKG